MEEERTNASLPEECRARARIWSESADLPDLLVEVRSERPAVKSERVRIGSACEPVEDSWNRSASVETEKGGSKSASDLGRSLSLCER